MEFHKTKAYMAPRTDASPMIPELLCNSDAVTEGGLEDITVEDWTL